MISFPNLRPARTLVAATLLAVSAFGYGQATPKGKTSGELAADAFATQLSASLKAQGVSVTKSALHYVFLVDLSQANLQSPVVLWEREFIDATLRSLQEYEAKTYAPTSRSLVSVYPYQLDLYEKREYPNDPTRNQWATDGEPLTAESLKRATGLLRGTIPFRPNGEPYAVPGAKYQWFGHDNVGPRAQLMRLLGPSKDGRPNVVIQLTPNPLNEAPGRPDLQRRIGNQETLKTGVSEAGYTNVLASEADIRLVEGQKRMRIWAYVPVTLSTLPKPERTLRQGDPRPNAVVRPTTTPASSGSGAGPIVLGGLVVAAVVGGAAVALSRKTTVIVDGSAVTLRVGKAHPLRVAPPLGGDQKHVADLKLGPFASAPSIEAVGCTLDVGGKRGNRFDLRRRATTNVRYMDAGTQGGALGGNAIKVD